MPEELSGRRGEAPDWPQLMKTELPALPPRLPSVSAQGVHCMSPGWLDAPHLDVEDDSANQSHLLLLTKVLYGLEAAPYLMEKNRDDGASLGHLASLNGLHTSKVIGFPRLTGAEVCPSSNVGAGAHERCAVLGPPSLQVMILLSASSQSGPPLSLHLTLKNKL